MAKRDEGMSMDSISKDFSGVHIEGDGENSKSEKSLGDEASPLEDYLDKYEGYDLLDFAAFEPAVKEKLKEKIDTMDLWTDKEVETTLAGLVSGRVAKGHSFVYRLWKSALNYWLKKDMNVVIVSPFIDSERLLDVMTLKMANKNEGYIRSIYIRDKVNDGRILEDMKAKARSYYPASGRLDSFLRTEVYSKISNIYASGNPTRYFHCKFIAALKDRKVSVLSGSANFQAKQFECMHDGYENLENIACHTMSEKTFYENYLNPLTDLEKRSSVMNFPNLPGMD